MLNILVENILEENLDWNFHLNSLNLKLNKQLASSVKLGTTFQNF